MVIRFDLSEANRFRQFRDHRSPSSPQKGRVPVLRPQTCRRDCLPPAAAHYIVTDRGFVQMDSNMPQPTVCRAALDSNERFDGVDESTARSGTIRAPNATIGSSICKCGVSHSRTTSEWIGSGTGISMTETCATAVRLALAPRGQRFARRISSDAVLMAFGGICIGRKIVQIPNPGWHASQRRHRKRSDGRSAAAMTDQRGRLRSKRRQTVWLELGDPVADHAPLSPVFCDIAVLGELRVP